MPKISHLSLESSSKSHDHLVPLLALLRRGCAAGGIAVQQHAQEIPPINQSHVRRMSLQSSIALATVEE